MILLFHTVRRNSFVDFPLIRVWYCAFGPFRSLRMSEPYYVNIQAILVKNAAIVIICIA